MAMSLGGLKTFDEAFARKKQVLDDFKESCPNHDSQFLLKMDEVDDRLISGKERMNDCEGWKNPIC